MEKHVFRVPLISDFVERVPAPLSAVTRAGDFVFVSGLPPIDPQTRDIEIVDVRRQTALVLDHVKASLEVAGTSLDKVVKCTIWITNAGYFNAVTEVYAGYFPKDPPALTFVGLNSWIQDFDVEVECIAIA